MGDFAIEASIGMTFKRKAAGAYASVMDLRDDKNTSASIGTSRKL
jgi:hypothetical protein